MGDLLMTTDTLDLYPGAVFTREDFDPEMLEDLRDCASPGADASEAVQYFARVYNVIGTDLDQYLRGYGAWEEDDLADPEFCLERTIWLIAGDIREAEANGSTDWLVCIGG